MQVVSKLSNDSDDVVASFLMFDRDWNDAAATSFADAPAAPIPPPPPPPPLSIAADPSAASTAWSMVDLRCSISAMIECSGVFKSCACQMQHTRIRDAGQNTHIRGIRTDQYAAPHHPTHTHTHRDHSTVTRTTLPMMLRSCSCSLEASNASFSAALTFFSFSSASTRISARCNTWLRR